MSKFIRADLSGIKYKPVMPLDVIAAEIGLPEEELIKLDANENLWELPAEVRSSMSACCMHIYPDPMQWKLRTALASLHGVSIDQICTGAGSDDMLDVILRLFETESIIISPPTFGMYSFLAQISKVKTIEVSRDADFNIQVDRVVDTIRQNNTKIVFFPSPNNPTGTVVSNSDVEKLCAEDCVVVIDEAYADFSGVSALPLVAKYSNLIVLRTFSKWAGLAGLRVGYAVADPAVIQMMIAIKQPYNVNAAAEQAAIAALEHRDKILVTVDALVSERNRLTQELTAMSFLQPVKSESNFVLCRVVGVSAEAVSLSLRSRGILVRYFGQQGGDLKDYIRISAGRPQDTDRVLTGLREAHASLEKGKALVEKMGAEGIECVLFDMDGVLANVSSSYRVCIIQTARKYGIEITNEDVNAEKARGNANDDWILTHRMIGDRWVGDGAPPSLQDVTDAFELLYQGTAEIAGLQATEKLLPSRVLLQNISKKYPCAIVTGRPRADAERFLANYKISEFFKHLVCMHEAPSKPDPAPVRLALSKLGCSRAIMIGDTVDDIRAGVSAGVFAVGVPAPGHENDSTISNFIGNGASFVASPGLPELFALL